GAAPEAVRAPPVPVVDAARHRARRAASRAGDGAAHGRLRHPRPEARDVPRDRAPRAVPPGLQALLPRGQAPLHAPGGTPDPAGGELRQLPVTAVSGVTEAAATPLGPVGR